jgi:ABC-2 type transport system ATP-binding protein
MLATSESRRFLGELESVYKSFGDKSAVDGLDLNVGPGELLALLGPNGAGKTTAIGMLLGLQKPDGGSVRLFGLAPSNIEARRGIGVMLQEEELASELKVRELIDSVTSYYPDPYTVDEVLKLTDTTALADRRYGKLSGGQKRLVQFALAICGRPKLMFLDEPTTGLDIDARETLWKTIREFVARGTSVILTTHYLEEAEALADRVVVLVGGRSVASGTLEHIRSFVNRKRISCRTTLDIGEIKTWPGVTDTELDDSGRAHVTVDDAEAETVARRLFVTDLRLREVEIHRAGLNEAFRKITQEVTQ